jgi:hypothetical protein
VKASVVRQPKKVYCEMIGIGAKSITIVRAVQADLFFDCRAAEVRVLFCYAQLTFTEMYNLSI